MSFGSWLKDAFTPIDQEAVLDKAVNELYSVNTDSKDIVDAIQKTGLSVTITNGTLAGDVLASTSVTGDGAAIMVDCAKVARAHDNLLPVVAHEIWHSKECFIVKGLAEFIATVERDKDKPWEDRELEQHAMAYEDELRPRLIRLGYHMAMTRRAAQMFATATGFRG